MEGSLGGGGAGGGGGGGCTVGPPGSLINTCITFYTYLICIYFDTQS